MLGVLIVQWVVWAWSVAMPMAVLDNAPYRNFDLAIMGLWK